MSYVRVSIIGTSVGGEVWSINPTIDPTFEFGTTVDQTALDAAADAISALSPGGALLGSLSTAFSVTGCRLEVRDDSTDALIGISVQVRPVPLPGSGVPIRPAQCAIVFSLRTDTPGGSGRGRVYWPNIAGSITTQLRITPTDQTSYLAGMATYLHAMESALATAFPTIGFDLAVRSRTTHSTPHVNKIQIGNVIDTQRRRRDKMVEDYVSQSF